MSDERVDPMLEILKDSADSLRKQLQNLGVACQGIGLLDAEGHPLLPLDAADW